MEFQSFDKIERFGNMKMTITQKLHGTNAQVVVFKNELGNLEIRCGSRSRYIFPGDDNYGFASFVYKNKDAFLSLGEGHHYGEWVGPGINSGEGLAEKTFVLFDYWKYTDRPSLPPQTVVVPVLYHGPFVPSKIDEVLEDLKTNGSKLVPGFMRPEGVVLTIAGKRSKIVFEAEETQWKGTSGVKAPRVEGPDMSHLLQPIRLEKLLSRDERYVSNYPSSLPDICRAYIVDLESEGQIPGDADEVKATKKALGKVLFSFVKEMVQK